MPPFRFSRSESTVQMTTVRAARLLGWSAVWLAVTLVAVKASYLGRPDHLSGADVLDYVRSVAAISYVDVVFAAATWSIARLLLSASGTRRVPARLISLAFVFFAACACLYAVANVVMFGSFGGFVTYPLLALIGSVRMIRSSVATYLTWRVVTALFALPILYVTAVFLTVRLVRPASRPRWQRGTVLCAALGIWVVFGQHSFATEWSTRQGRRIAENPHWVLLSSWWHAVSGDRAVRISERFAADDLLDFQPAGLRQPPPPVEIIRKLSRWRPATKASAPRRPPNVILIVLESVGERWTSLGDTLYDTTPTLKAESAHALVVDNFYAHIGRSSNSLSAILLSAFPRLDFRDLTEEYPRLPGTSLAAVFHERGYRTNFVTASDLTWAGWDTFLDERGFDQLRDFHGLACTQPLSSWGVEDRCMIDAMVEYIGANRDKPFFLMGWTEQTHHPYEPTPGVPLLDLAMQREPVPDDWNLGRYLNVLRETDRHLARVFDAVRAAGLADDTVIVITGDHGQAFGYPHNGYMQGQNVYEEDVHVPLMIWSPRTYRTGARSNAIGSHVDLAPTIASLAGVAAAPDWQGHSVLDTAHAPRAYFYVAEDHFTLGVREQNWKYIFNLREGTEELYDLARDPLEQHNMASLEPARCARLRQRLAAWTEANRRQYERVAHPAPAAD